MLKYSNQELEPEFYTHVQYFLGGAVQYPFIGGIESLGPDLDDEVIYYHTHRREHHQEWTDGSTCSRPSTWKTNSLSEGKCLCVVDKNSFNQFIKG